MTQRVLIPRPGDTSLCYDCGYVIEAFEHHGLTRWRHQHDSSERHKLRRIRKDPRAAILRPDNP